jgi:glycine/D-amino acid oxidase-like deaminating enzyme
MTFDAIIVGAGIAGSTCAYELAEAGLRVAIVEAGAPGAATTSAGMGHVVVMDDSAAQFALTRYSRSVWDEHGEMLNEVKTEYAARGTVWVASNDEEIATIYARHWIYEQAGVACEILDSKALSARVPSLRPGLPGGLFVRHDGVCEPPACSAIFLAHAQTRGANLIFGRAVSAANGVVLLEDGSRLEAGWIVLATGIDCALLPSLPIRKRKGHLIMTAPQPGFLAHQVVELGYLRSAHAVEEDSVAFNVQPRLNGQIMIGASRQYANDDPAPDRHILDQLLARAHAFMPALATIPTQSVRTGFRAATPDKLPFIGPTADPTLYLLAGFEGLGITCTPGAARLLADRLLDRQPAIDPTPYLPSRFMAEDHRG